MGTNRTDQKITFTTGDRVELTGEPPGYAIYALAAGECGTVDIVDSLGTIHIRWDNGARVGILDELTGLLHKVESR
jgi:hypothetical protein